MVPLFLVLSLLPAAPKGGRRPVPRTAHVVRARAEKVVNLYNYHTKEILPLGSPSMKLLRHFFRCRVTGLPAPLDPKLVKVLREAAAHFGKDEITIISGYRSPRFNTELRKKLHQVARRSLHTQGKAVDFTIPGVEPVKVVRWLRRRKLGGVGYYNTSKFLHFDTGPVRNWRGV